MKDVLLSLAKAAIAASVGEPVAFDLEKTLALHPELRKPGASFVTINKRPDNTLRGCIGSLRPHRPLFEDIIYNAKAAALNDPRFPPLKPEELDKIKVEVSILSEPAPINYTSVDDLKRKIRPGIDGVVLTLDNRQATYLPQVWEELPRFDQFFASLCLKASLKPDCLKHHPQISTYQVKKYEED